MNSMMRFTVTASTLEHSKPTNNFPEFTGRVCPAPCVKALLCSWYQFKTQSLSVISRKQL
ncbi:hypothetical protein O9992_11955 [Vibrio lentus]|nr:hypothetical protein [Vibrio lentus]